MNRKIKYIMLLCFTINLLTSTPSYALDKYLLDFDDPGASGTTWPGWTWTTNADGYNKPGWQRDAPVGHNLAGNWWPRLHETGGYGQANLAIIDTTTRAPSTSTGNSLKVYDTTGGSVYQASWWYLFGDNFGTYGYADNNTNRMDFYLKLSGTPKISTTSFPGNGNIHVGTYLCWPGGGASGESCPTEAGNQHYYHMYLVNPDSWVHVQLDQHPTHQRNMGSQGGGPEPGNDPQAPNHHYFASLGNGFYVEIRDPQPNPTAYWIDEIKTWQQTQPENEDSITSVAIGNTPSTNKWAISFNDTSITGQANCPTAFEMRWSTQPITNANWASANPITPDLYRRGSTNVFTRPDTWARIAYNEFSLPAGTETNNNKLYFAIKDASSTASGDYHNAVSSNIKTIDYNIRPGSGTSDTTAPAAPTGLRAQ